MVFWSVQRWRRGRVLGFCGGAIAVLLGPAAVAQIGVPLPVPPQNLPSGVQGEQGVCLVSPQGAETGKMTFSTSPVFVWQGAVIGRIELFDVTTGELAWSGTPELPVPQISYHSTPLTPGHEYRWTLFSRSNEPLGSADFAIMDEAQRSPIQLALDTLTDQLTAAGKTPAEINVAIVDYFNSQGLWADAVTAAIDAYPPSPSLGRYVRTLRSQICR